MFNVSHETATPHINGLTKLETNLFHSLASWYMQVHHILPGNREGCGRKGIGHKHAVGCMDGLALAIVGVAAAGLLVVVQ